MPLIARESNLVFNTEEDIVLFGKYKGRKIGELIESDPAYVNWCVLNMEQFRLSDKLETFLCHSLDESGSDDDYEGWWDRL